MKNEIQRKITSLTLMTIMLAGGMVIAAPGMMPAAHAANANLFVSAENSQFDNYMSGPQVIEIVIIDSDINDTDEAKGEPDVTINGKILRMVQAVDGNWYGYFADRTQASIADSTASDNVVGGAGDNSGVGLDFGTLCTAGTGVHPFLGIDVSDTSGVAVSATGGIGGLNGTSTGAVATACTASNSVANSTNNVVREFKDVNISLDTTTTDDEIGQIGLGDATQIGVTTAKTNLAGLWPFIQLYDLNPTGNVIIQYNKGGGAQSVTLTFDTVEGYAGISLDRANYPTSAQVHVTITDLWLNIDPTDEDSWTFGTLGTNTTAFYQLYDENGDAQGDGLVDAGFGDIIPLSGVLMCEDNCILILDKDAQNTGGTSDGSIVTLNSNEDSSLATDGSTAVFTIAAADQPVTITEQGVKSGVFATYDEFDTSVIQINATAPRGTSATIDYNESPISILRADNWADVQINPIDDEWNSGEEIPIVIVDGDLNKNSRVDEDLDLFNPVIFIPALTTGDPFTLGEGTTSPQAYVHNSTTTPSAQTFGAIGTVEALITLVNAGPNNNTATIDVQLFEERAIMNNYTSTEGGAAGSAANDIETST